MAQYEERWINGSKYTVPVGLRADWKPGQAYNVSATTTTAASTPKTTYASNDSTNSAYGITWGPTSTTKKTTTKKTTTKKTTTTPETSQSRTSSSDIADIFNQLLNRQSEYTPPSESQLREWASSYASTSVNPLLSAIQTRLANERAAQENARREIEAAYAGLPAQYQSRLDEARRSALESAIARGMGRSGVVDWQTAKLSEPIMQEQAQSEREKAAKLAAIANAISTAEATAAQQTQAAEQQRAALEASRMGELQQWLANLAAQSRASDFSNVYNLANLYNQSRLADTSNLYQLLSLLMAD